MNEKFGGGSLVPETRDDSNPETVESDIEVLEVGKQDLKIFGKEVIKRKDLREVEQGLDALYNDDDAASAFKLARQLSQLKRAKFELSSAKFSVVKTKLLDHAEEMRERGPRAVAQYHAYLKYLKMEDQISDEDKELIKRGLENERRLKRGKIASLAMNANYLGLEEVMSDDNFDKDLQDDLASQIKNNFAPVDKIALELARRKQLGKSGKLPVIDSKYNESCQRKYDEKGMEGYLKKCAESGSLQKYLKLKAGLDYIRGDSVIEDSIKDELINKVGDLANSCGSGGKGWGEYVEYVSDLSSLSRRQEKLGNSESPVGADGSRAVEGDNIEILDIDDDNINLDEENRDKIDEEFLLDPLDVDDSDEENRGKTGEEFLLAPSDVIFPETDKDDLFLDDDFNARSENAFDIVEANTEKNLDALKGREEKLLDERKDLMVYERVNVFEELMEELQKSDKKNRKQLMQEYVSRHIVDDGGRDADNAEVLKRYQEVLADELFYAVELDKSGIKSAVNSATSLKKRNKARAAVSKWGEQVKAKWSKNLRDELWSRVIEVRSLMVLEMINASNSSEIGPDEKRILKRMALEFELLNVRDAQIRIISENKK